jgi:hypothetical protein
VQSGGQDEGQHDQKFAGAAQHAFKMAQWARISNRKLPIGG